MNRIKFVTLGWAVVSLVGITAAIATPPSGTITRNELAVGKVTDPIDIQRRSRLISTSTSSPSTPAPTPDGTPIPARNTRSSRRARSSSSGRPNCDSDHV